MDLSGAIISLGALPYNVTRRTTGGYTAGRLNAPSTATVPIVAMVQPLSGRDLKRMPEGMQTSELRAIWTTSELKLAGGGFEPDLVTVDGISWEVQLFEDWAVLGNYRRYIAAKVDKT